jgi:transposase-like protein
MGVLQITAIALCYGKCGKGEAMPQTKRPDKAALLPLYTEEGLTDREIARRLKVNPSTVYRWRKKYGIHIEVEQIFRARLKREVD